MVPTRLARAQGRLDVDADQVDSTAVSSTAPGLAGEDPVGLADLRRRCRFRVVLPEVTIQLTVLISGRFSMGTKKRSAMAAWEPHGLNRS